MARLQIGGVVFEEITPGRYRVLEDGVLYNDTSHLWAAIIGFSGRVESRIMRWFKNRYGPIDILLKAGDPRERGGVQKADSSVGGDGADTPDGVVPLGGDEIPRA